AKLFTGLAGQRQKTKPVAIVNVDDRYGQQLLGRLDKSVVVITYGMGLRADFRASNYRAEFTGTSYQLDARGKSYLVRLPLIGRFNVTNSIAALAAADALGINLRNAVLGLAKAPQVPGRLELVPAKRQFQVFVDYAHTPDALGNVLKTLRELQPNRLITVFGCGGDRDRQKRPFMAGLGGEKFDGHHFVESAAKSGATGALVDQNWNGNVPEDFVLIRATDTLHAYQQIAANYRRSLALKVAAITGSNGKTSTKDFAA